MKKTVEITLETAKQMYNSGVESLKQLALDNFTKEELEKIPFPTWEELKSNYQNLNPFGSFNPKYVEKLIALDRLLYARDIYNGDWKPNWCKGSSHKYIIKAVNDKIILDTFYSTICILTFKDKETRDAFYENFKDLIEEAKELL